MKRPIAIILTVAGLVLVIVLWHISHRQPLITPPPPVTFDQYQADLATRVDRLFGTANDFSVVVALASYPIGTLLRATGSLQADSEDCLPESLPKASSAPHLFPSYTITVDTAFSANLKLSAIQSAGANLRQTQNVQYQIADTMIRNMDDRSVDLVTSKPACGQYISSHPGVRLIRGAVTGKMTFTIKVSNPGSVKARLASIGGFTIEDNPDSSTLSIVDKQSEPIVLLLSEFGNSPTAAAGAKPTPKPVTPLVAAQRSPASNEIRPHIFVQMDAQDNPASGARVVQVLHGEWPTANVESNVERIPTEKMPTTAQVRYFNASDESIAERCAGILKSSFASVRVVRVGLPSPQGQLEVWLPKAAGVRRRRFGIAASKPTAL
jgi:hypothetical protein